MMTMACPGATTRLLPPSEYISKGPLLHLCAGTSALDIREWTTHGQRLAVQLGFDHDSMDDVQRRVGEGKQRGVHTHPPMLGFP